MTCISSIPRPMYCHWKYILFTRRYYVSMRTSKKQCMRNVRSSTVWGNVSSSSTLRMTPSRWMNRRWRIQGYLKVSSCQAWSSASVHIANVMVVIQ